MQTLILHIKDENDPQLETAARILREGGTVIFPTETVYGLGANGLSAEAAGRIYAAKGRPSDNPLILHIADWRQISQVAAVVPPVAEALARHFWPGPLTLILQKRPEVPAAVTGGLDTVAVRLPAHPVARRLIALAGVPVAAPSANLSGKPSPTRAAHVVADMDGRVDCILCGEASHDGVESTVLDLTVTPPVVLRPGGVTLEALQAVLPEVVMDLALEAHQAALTPKAPGMKYAHYAPEAPLTLFTGAGEAALSGLTAAVRASQASGLSVAVMAQEEHRSRFEALGAAFVTLGAGDRPEEAARLLFQALRQCNELEVAQIFALGIPERGIGRAVMNRLRKAAGGNVVE